MTSTPQKRILLTGVFGPYGVDDEYGRKENIMELFHNQVTKGQGTASFRFLHRSFGLYFIAANLDADVTVLDFPSKKRFEREIKKGYDIVGISFIAPNFTKAREMGRLIRTHAPDSTIILGGHGAAIEGVEKQIDCDHVAKGEGIRWMRRFIGQNLDDPFVHPAMPSTERQSIYGVPLPGPTAGLLVTGVGCVNGCSFCCTSHFFQKTYTPFIGDGRELFETCRRIADIRGSDTFFIMDENFLKKRERAMELIAEMEKHNRFFKFHVFSSAEALTAFGMDNLVRLGAQFVWIGFESQSRQDTFVKNKGIDPKQLVKDMRDRGVSVLASGILCMEHHTPENIQEDIDFLVGLEADLVQFMLLTPLPTTALYQDHKARGIFKEDVAWEDSHGQKKLNYHHPAFSDDEPEQWLNKAFRQEFEVNSSSMYRVADTSVRGYNYLAAKPSLDACLEARKAQLEERAREYGCMTSTIAWYAVNEKERQRAHELRRDLQAAFGKPTIKEKLMRAGALAMAIRWRLRTRLVGDRIQPATIVTRFEPKERGAGKSPVPLINIGSSFIEEISRPTAAAAMVRVEQSSLVP
ncbi:MAG: radical SAM protein [Deltaproteobacteria bacterium]|nr:radical SAM protein [Deltaproteobacteria bacterium]